jgi:hypothetical protein
VSLLNLSEVVGDKADASRITDGGALSYFRVLCRQPVPGPLVGGSAATKDVNKWLDEMITWYESSTSEYERGDPRRLLISLLKILCQHYGKLRAPFGSDPSQEVLFSYMPYLVAVITVLLTYITVPFCCVPVPLYFNCSFKTFIRRNMALMHVMLNQPLC